MIYEQHLLRDLFPLLPDVGFDAKITCMIPKCQRSNAPRTKKLRPCVVLCPGGGYHVTVPREGEPVALYLVGNEIPVVIVDYSCPFTPNDRERIHFPVQLQEISCAVAYAKRHAKEWDIDPEKVFVLGFSAGGHAVGTVGCFWNKEFAYKPIGLEYGENKPCGMLLCYPVITSGKYAHRGSFENLLGENATAEQLDSVSLEKCVGENTVPAFLWQTVSDELVPVQNSLLMGKALADAGVPFEMHIYPRGPHGMSSSTYDSFCARDSIDFALSDVEHVHEWLSNAVKWIKSF